MRSGSYLYHIIEAPDITLGCLTTPGVQNWVLGLLRAPTFAYTSGQWAQFVVEPVVVPVVKQGCYIQVRCVAHGVLETRGVAAAVINVCVCVCACLPARLCSLSLLA